MCLHSKSYYAFTKKHGSAIHVAFLDASKAFDRVNRRKLLLKLESRGVPTYILRLLSNELIGQYNMCSLGFHSLRFFPIGNGVQARTQDFLKGGSKWKGK